MRFAFGWACLFVLQAQDPVALAVRTSGGQETFHIGERIPLELSFTSSSASYQLNTASYDRGGRLAVESYKIEPDQGWDDPLDLYFQSYGGFMGGGLSGFQRLSAAPSVIHRDLNEWVRFNQPGRYRLVVASSRVSRVGTEFRSPAVEVSSGELWLTIIPATAEWQAAALEQARAILAHQPTGGLPPSGPSPAAQAVATLRYIGTPAAAREMARGLTEPSFAFQFKLGLASTPARDAAMKSLDELLNDPDFPVNGNFLDTMSLVGLPPGKTDHRPEERVELETKFRTQLIAALGRKRGAALAVSAYTIVDEAAMRGHDLPGDLKQRLTAELVAGFDRLPLQDQTELFQTRWRVLDQKAMQALLPKLAAHSNDQMSGAALVRWWQLDPQAARPAIIQEIERPHPRFGASILGMLPEEELPEVSLPLADHLSHGANAASLIARYATAAIEPQVAGYLDERLGKIGCLEQAALLAYLLRVDAQDSIRTLEKAVAARGEGFSACNHSLFTDVAELHNDPALEQLALRSLDDRDPQVVANAATYLGAYASAAAEEPLWTHFIAWSRRWKGREEELRFIPGEKISPLIFEDGAGTAMLNALAAGQGWLTDETKLNRLLDLSVGPNQRAELEQFLKSWQARPRQIQFTEPGRQRFQIAQYSPRSLQLAIEKLNQFPPGTTFQRVGAAGWENEEKAFEEVSKAVANHEIHIVNH